MTLHKSSLTWVALLATLTVLTLLLVPSPAATEGPLPPGPAAAEPPAAGVYWVRLRSHTLTLPDDLQTALRTLRAEGRVLDFEFLPNRNALRVVAFPEGVERLATHWQVAEVEPLHVRPERSPREPSPVDSAIQATYRISGTVRSHEGAPLQGVSVSTDWDDPDDAWASSDAGGLYQLTVGVAGTYHIGAYKFGLPSPPRQTVTVPPDAGGIDLVFPPTYTLSGVVRDQDGNRVAGASVFGGLEVGTTAADGSYTIVEGPGDHYVSAAKNGYQSPYSVLVPLPPAATGVNLLLLREDGTIRGRMVDDRGTPVAGATVWADNIVCADLGTGAAQTGADGTYTLAVPSGIYHVGAFKERHVPASPAEVSVPSGTPAQVDMILNRAQQVIQGTVRDGAGQPLQGARVTASTCGLSYSVSTDASGTYTLPVGAETYTVGASKVDYVGGDAQMVSVPPDATGVDFVLIALTFYTIEGRVTDPTGQPIEDVAVWTSWRDDPYATLDWTDKEGRYKLRVPAGTYHVSAFEHGYTRPPVQVVTVPPSRTDVDFVMSPTGLSIQGTIRDSSGAPLPTGWVSTWLPGETSSWMTRAYYDGTYLRGMSAGTHDVHGSADCHASAWVRGVTLPPSRTGIDFSLAPTDQLISGVVSDSNGAPVCDAWVRATSPDASDSSATARNGRYALQVPAGTYAVRASKAGYGPAPDRTVTVPPHARGTNFVLGAPSNTIRGVVRDNKGAAIQGATVLAGSAAGSVSAPSGADGSYAIQVFDGSWTVSAGKAGYVTFTAPQSVSVPPDRSGIDFALVPEGDVRRTYVPLILR